MALTKMEKTFVGLGVGTTALLALGFGMVAFHGPYNGDAAKPAAQSAPAANSAGGQAPALQTVANTMPPAPNTAWLEPLPANARTIPDHYLEELSAAVNLAGAREQPPDKGVWTEALPVAQKLMDGPCDCAQKVWLKHFIEMGNYALTDATRQYHETAGLMATLGRNDEQAMELSKKPK